MELSKKTVDDRIELEFNLHARTLRWHRSPRFIQDERCRMEGFIGNLLSSGLIDKTRHAQLLERMDEVYCEAVLRVRLRREVRVKL